MVCEQHTVPATMRYDTLSLPIYPVNPDTPETNLCGGGDRTAAAASLSTVNTQTEEM